jgi:L-amino acid N-acyltransferase YncA
MTIEEIKKHTDAIIAKGFTFKPDTIEVKEQTIKSYHEHACPNFKTRIEKDFPALFEVTLEVGKWYKTKKHERFLMFLKKDADFSNYGFDIMGEWSNQLGMASRDSLTPATDKEVSTALIAEAKKRGYKSGNHMCLAFIIPSKRIKDEFFFKHGRLWIGKPSKGNLIFDKGVWSEIINEPVYEWQYVYYTPSQKNYSLTHAFYKSKKHFLKAMPNLKPLHKVKESKRIRE